MCQGDRRVKYDFMKNELRKQISNEIAALEREYIAASDEVLALRVTSLKEFIDAGNILLYYSVKREPDTHNIAKAAFSMGKKVAYPYCYRGGVMEARIVNGLHELQPSMLGIPAPPETAPLVEPDRLDFILVPALTYDRAGYRIGYGGGYYDRYLHEISAFTAGLGRERLLWDKLPNEPHDVAVKCLITEKEVSFCP